MAKSWLKFRSVKRAIASLGMGLTIAAVNIFVNFANPTPTYSAEQIRFWYAPFGEFTIYINDLEQFAKEGKQSDRLSFYLSKLTQQQQTQVREALSTRYNISHVAIAGLTYSAVGEILVRRLGGILQITPELNGFSALRSTLILSAASDQGLSMINVLQRYPVPIIYLDLPKALRAYGEFSQLTAQKDLVFAAIQKQAISENNSLAISQNDLRSDLRIAGNVQWTKEQFTYLQGDRDLVFSADIYLPKSPTSPAPLIVISHGLGSNPYTLHYLSEHLASHGFAVAAIEHPKTNSRDYATFLANLAKGEQFDEAVQRPIDVKYVLDALEYTTKTDPRWRDRLNPEQVGLIGQSLGGYTVLALAGAQINVNPECLIPEAEVISFNVSQMLQCRFSFLASPNINLSDRRVKAVLALNPLGGSMLLGKEGMQNIKVPIAIFSGGNDLLTPAIPEQIFPFVWSTSSHKYLVAFPKGTHFSFLERSESGVLIIPKALFGEPPEVTHPYAKAISLAFFETYLNNRSEFAAYLNNAYIQAIASPQFPASLTTTFSESQLLQSF